MKKVLMSLLLLIATCDCIGQTVEADNFYGKPWYINPKIKIEYFGINGIYGKTSIVGSLQLLDKEQIPVLPNMDSILQILKNDFKYLKDSLRQDGSFKKLEYVAIKDAKSNRFRLTQTEKTNYQSYTVKDKELSYVKDEWDSLIIKYFVKIDDNNSSHHYYRGKEKILIDIPVYFAISIASLNKIDDIDSRAVQSCFEFTKKKYIETKQFTEEKFKKTVTIFRDELELAQFHNSCNFIYFFLHPNLYKSSKLDGLISFGIQPVKSTLLTQFNFGLNQSITSRWNTTTVFSLTLDNYFHFYNDINNISQTDAYRFLNFKFYQPDKSLEKEKGFHLRPGFSFGYLISSNGNLFDKRTMKLGFPNASFGIMNIEPEIFFTDFFKKTSLGLKLSMNLDFD